MKILFHNYSNQLSTEPLYLHNALLKCDINSSIWSNPKASAYDVFDTIVPDVFVTHFQTLTYDIMDYIKKNGKNINVVMNATGASQSQINSIENVFSEERLIPPILFTNSFSHTIKTKLKFFTLYPAADLFIVNSAPFIDSGIPEAILADEFDENVQNYIGEKSVFHLLYISGKDLDSNFDIKVAVHSLPQLYKFYPKFVLIGDNDICCSQIFFDMVLNCKTVEVKSSDKKGFENMLKSIFVDSENLDIHLEMKSQIKARHTPFHRASKLIKNLDDESSFKKIEKLKDNLPAILKGI
jgi:hypothetical protein